MAQARKTARRIKHLSWVALSLPALFIGWAYATDAISYGQVIHQTGNWSVALLALALLVTPLRHLFLKQRWPLQLQQLRRGIGVASFGYAALHTLVYLERKWGYGYIIKEAQNPALLTGWIALGVFLVLALTSNDYSTRLLRKRWQRLHRTVYVATALIFAHWILTAVDTTTAWVCAALLATFFVTRWMPARNGR